jgi:hypothetical protein
MMRIVTADLNSINIQSGNYVILSCNGVVVTSRPSIQIYASLEFDTNNQPDIYNRFLQQF